VLETKVDWSISLYARWPVVVVIIRGDISKSYEQWKEVFDAGEPYRAAAGIEGIYSGHELEDERKVYVV
tara:strand:+ start:203 stop:409 length:207 start_codon:yes stop_codon:yes gene_type:complete